MYLLVNSLRGKLQICRDKMHQKYFFATNNVRFFKNIFSIEGIKEMLELYSVNKHIKSVEVVYPQGERRRE